MKATRYQTLADAVETARVTGELIARYVDGGHCIVGGWSRGDSHIPLEGEFDAKDLRALLNLLEGPHELVPGTRHFTLRPAGLDGDETKSALIYFTPEQIRFDGRSHDTLLAEKLADALHAIAPEMFRGRT